MWTNLKAEGTRPTHKGPQTDWSSVHLLLDSLWDSKALQRSFLSNMPWSSRPSFPTSGEYVLSCVKYRAGKIRITGLGAGEAAVRREVGFGVEHLSQELERKGLQIQ